MRAEDLVAEQIERCYLAEKNGSKYPGMTYEEGIRAALDWVTGFSDDEPMEGDEE